MYHQVAILDVLVANFFLSERETSGSPIFTECNLPICEYSTGSKPVASGYG